MFYKLSLTLVLCFSTLMANADGLLGIDHRLNFDNSGIWSRSNQKTLEMGSAAVVIAGALWEGNDTRLGKTFWKSTESMLMGDALAQAGKLVLEDNVLSMATMQALGFSLQRTTKVFRVVKSLTSPPS